MNTHLSSIPSRVKSRIEHQSLVLILGILVVASLLSGCGPTTAHSAISQAKIALELSEGVQAQNYAIYEYRRALLYYNKAKEEEGFSSFQKAIDYAVESRNFSDKARALTAERSQEQRKEMIKPSSPNVSKKP